MGRCSGCVGKSLGLCQGCWIQGAVSKHTKGALHRQLGIPQGQKIPKKTLTDIKKTRIGEKSHGKRVTTLLKRRVVFALNAQKRK